MSIMSVTEVSDIDEFKEHVRHALFDLEYVTCTCPEFRKDKGTKRTLDVEQHWESCGYVKVLHEEIMTKPFKYVVCGV